MKRNNRKTWIAFVSLLIVGSGIVYAINSNAANTGQIDLLLNSVDSSINAIQIQCERVDTYAKSFINEVEQRKESMVNSRRKPRSDEDKIVPYQAKVYENDKVGTWTINISLLNNKTRIAYDFPGEGEDYIFFYEPGKMYDIGWAGSKLDRKQVVVDNIQQPPFVGTTAHIFGRGLSRYAGYPKKMEKMDENQYQLTIFSPSQDRIKEAEFVLDSSKNYCWTSGRTFLNDGSVMAELQASDFREKDKTVFPYSVVMTFYNKGEFMYKYQIFIRDISPLPDDKNELNVFDDIPANTELLKSY